MKMLLKAATFLAATAALCVATPSYGDTVVFLHVSVDTSSLAPGTQGFLDLQWSGGAAQDYNQTGTATILNFVNTGGFFTEAEPRNNDDFGSGSNVIGNVVGTLPGTTQMTVDSTGGFNIYTQGIQFGSRMDFDLRLATTSDNCDVLASGDCSMPGFGMDLLNSTGTGFLLSGDPLGESDFNWLLLHAQVQPDGTFDIVTPPGPAGASVVSVAPVPEAPVWLMLLAGFGAVGCMLRMRPRMSIA